MLQFDELRLILEEIGPEIKDLSEALGLDSIKKEIESLDIQASKPGFWDDTESSQKIIKRMSLLKNKLSSYKNLYSLYEDTCALVELANEEEDLSLLPEAQQELDKVKSELENLRLSTLLTGEYDSNNAILTFHAGAGGTEA